MHSLDALADLGHIVLRDLRYVVLFVEDLERSLGFYRDTLGLEVRHRAEGYAELAVDGPKFALLERWRVPALVGDAEALRPPAGAHEAEVAFLVDDVDAVYGELRARDVVFVCAPTDRPWSQRTAYFKDPDGHLIEIAQNLKRA